MSATRARSMAIASVLLATVLATIGCHRSAPPEPEAIADRTATSTSASTSISTTSSASVVSSSSAAFDPGAELKKNLAASAALVPKGLDIHTWLQSCGAAGRYAIGAGEGVVERYECHGVRRTDVAPSPEGDDPLVCPECEVQRVHLVGAAPGNVLVESATLLTYDASVHGLWNLTGDGRHYAVLRAVECDWNPLGSISMTSCEPEQMRVYRYEDHAFAKSPLVLPWSITPAGEIDADKDGRPDLVVRLWQLESDVDEKPCTAVDDAWLIDELPGQRIVVDGLASWVESKKAFSTTLASFSGWYAMRLSAARSFAEHLAASVPDGGARCDVDAVRTAAEIALYGRVLGEDPSKLDAEASAVASGAAGWAKTRASILSATIPALRDAR